jgi:hypothetical protein
MHRIREPQLPESLDLSAPDGGRVIWPVLPHIPYLKDAKRCELTLRIQ